MNDERQKLTPFFTALKKYAGLDITPLDIPGHKLGRIHNEMRESVGEAIYLFDANAPKGLDNLNRPKGVIKESQELMAEAYGADKAYFLTGGTTQGILTMIMCACSAKDKIILPRNVHKSVISALILSGAIPIFIAPHIDDKIGIANGIYVKDVKKAIIDNPDAKAIFVINPTYFGVVSPLEEIVKLAHDANMLVLADEAHGSHLGFSDLLPYSAMQVNADMSASSLHKTIGSFTQSSVLLAKGTRVNYNKIRVTVNLLQSTSASSLLMAGLDVARKNMYFNGEKELMRILGLVEKYKKEINDIPGFQVIGKEYFEKNGGFEFDETKLLIKINELGKPGYFIYNILRDKYNIQIELAETYVILIVLTIASVEEDLSKLVTALKEVSIEYYSKEEKLPYKKFKYHFPKMYTRPREAFHAPKKFLKLADAIDEICAESIMVYPPGIPLVIPGEIITEEVVDLIDFYIENGFTILSEQDDDTFKMIDKEHWIKWGENDET